MIKIFVDELRRYSAWKNWEILIFFAGMCIAGIMIGYGIRGI
jgi:hypothetical protein